MIDQSQGNGWGSVSPTAPDAGIQPKFVVIQLPVSVNISELQINPSATCGDGGSASTGDEPRAGAERALATRAKTGAGAS